MPRAAANGPPSDCASTDERIASADAPGLERSLDGLTLLEAAAVGGEPLAVEALAAAVGQVFRAAPRPGRAAVAMSGGVDSAVTLLRAAPNAVGVTLRLWQDPHGPSSERACCSSEAVAAARSACHSLGVPHVTLDLREEFRQAVVDPFVAGYASGDTPNPCARCNGAFRFDALLAFAGRAGAEALWTGHYARVVERDGRLLVARARDTAKDQSYMLSTLDPAVLERVRFPLGEQTKDETRAEASSAGLAAATRAESQEACFLAGDDYRRFLERQGSAPRRWRDRRRARSGRRKARRLLGVHARPAPGPSRGGGSSAVCPAHRSREQLRGRRRSGGAGSDPDPHRRALVRAGRARRREAALPIGGGPFDRHGRERWFHALSRKSRARSCHRVRSRRSTTVTPWSAPGSSLTRARAHRRLGSAR